MIFDLDIWLAGSSWKCPGQVQMSRSSEEKCCHVDSFLFCSLSLVFSVIALCRRWADKWSVFQQTSRFHSPLLCRVVQYITNTNQPDCTIDPLLLRPTPNTPQEVMDRRFVEQEDKVEDVVNNQPSHVFSITQVLTLNTQTLALSHICNDGLPNGIMLLLCRKYEKQTNHGTFEKKLIKSVW